MIGTSRGRPQSLRRHSEQLKAQTGSVLNVPITARQRLIHAGSVVAKGLRVLISLGELASGVRSPVSHLISFDGIDKLTNSPSKSGVLELIARNKIT